MVFIHKIIFSITSRLAKINHKFRIIHNKVLNFASKKITKYVIQN